MTIQIDPHTLQRAEERGTNENEITDVINSGTPIRPNMADWARQKFLISKSIALEATTNTKEWKSFSWSKGML